MVNIDDRRVSCLICKSTDSSILHRFDEWKVIRCMNCEVRYIHPLPSQEQLKRNAEESHTGHGVDHIQDYFCARNLSNDRDLIVQNFSKILGILKQYVKGRKLLDVGSGDGTFVALANKEGWDAIGLDSSRTAAKFAKENYGVETLTCEYCSKEYLGKECFDVITMLDFLEHVIDPVAAVKQAHRLLKKDGVLLVNSPNHRSVLCWVIDTMGSIPVRSIRNMLQKYYGIAHVSIFDPHSLVYLFKQCGFTVEVVGENSPVLDRLTFSIPVKLILRLIISIGRLLHRQSRVWVLARVPID